MSALAGVRVLDLSRILAGPWASQLLADFGAEVVKIEKPQGGDDTRSWGPPWLGGDEAGEAAYFIAANRGKRSVAIDFTSEPGREILLKLVTRADVLIENYKLGGLRKYGLDWNSLQQINPRLVYCSITGFGQTGPYADRPGYDAAIQAMGGLMSITGEPDERPGGGPQKVGVAVADLMAGMYAATSILAALRHRDLCGQGQHIDISLLDCQVAWLANQASNYLIGGNVPGRQGTAHPNIVPYQSFASADGHLMLAIGNDAQFARFARIAGRPEWADDPRYASNPARVHNRKLLVPQIAAVMTQRRTASWLEALQAESIPAAPINDVAEVFADPQVQARELRLEMSRDDGEVVPVVRNPVRFSATPVEHRQAPPRLGQHTREVLSELGISCDQIDALRSDGLIGD